MTEQQTLDFAERFLSAIGKGDAAAVRGCYAPDAAIWHNHDGLEQSVDQNIKLMEWMARKLPDRRYRLVRREVLNDGFMQQHVLEATLPDGSAWSMAACVIVRIKDGLIVRLEEYLDSAAANAMTDAVRSNRPAHAQ